MSPIPANAANPMLPALQQWHGWPRGERRPSRWSDWSASRRGRSARRDERRPRTGMAFLNGGVARMQTAITRSSYAPHLTLSLRPVFLTARREHHDDDRRESPSMASPSPGYRVTRQSAEPSSTRRAAHERTETAPIASTLRSTPVTFARQRTAAARIDTDVRYLRDVADRVVRTHQRVETAVRSTAVIRERSNVAAEVERALATNAQHAAMSPMKQIPDGSAWSGANRFAMPNPADLEQLTDQIVTRIDDRLTAHRERMGRG